MKQKTKNILEWFTFFGIVTVFGLFIGHFIQNQRLAKQSKRILDKIKRNNELTETIAKQSARLREIIINKINCQDNYKFKDDHVFKDLQWDYNNQPGISAKEDYREKHLGIK